MAFFLEISPYGAFINPLSKSGLLDFYYNFSFGSTAFDVSQRIICLTKWKYLIDYGSYNSCFNQGRNFRQLLAICFHK